MKKIIVILFVIGFSFNATAQTTSMQDTTCSFLKNLTFKIGIDTIEVKATYDAFLEGSDQTFLTILADKKKLDFGEYMSHDESNSINFTPIGCLQSYQGTLSRKIYDKTFVRKTRNIGEFMKEIVDIDKMKLGQVVYVKCIVFEDKDVFYNGYFFTIIDLRIDK